MSVTAKNYAAQAYCALDERIKEANLLKFSQDAHNLGALRYKIKDSIHFAIPDNAVFFEKDKDFKALRGVDLRLPYESITVEYHCNVPVDPSSHNQTAATKRVIVAHETDVSTSPVETARCIMFHAMYFTLNRWFVAPYGGVIFRDWENVDRAFTGNGDGTLVNGSTVQFLVNILGEMGKRPDFNVIGKTWEREIFDEGSHLMSFLNVLSCSNVSTSICKKAAPPLVAQKRERKGKLPIYETRVLTIDSSSQGKSAKTSGGFHASPRTHLRRGHIRRIDDERRVWVNACVVGKAGKGIIEKQYKVTRG